MATKTKRKSDEKARADQRSGTFVEPGWCRVTTRRAGAPPLRFIGCEISRHEHDRCGSATAIILWKKRTAGFVATAAIGERRDSVSRASLGDIMSWLEEICDSQSAGKPCFQPDAAMLGPIEDFNEHRAFRILAGDAMDEWDRLSLRAAWQ